MKKVLHISSECYPAAKAGGMGDVVGALPIYLPTYAIEASVILPKYKNKWFKNQSFKSIHKGTFLLGERKISYHIERLKKGGLAFPFYCVDLPGLFDRESIYLGPDGHGYADEPARNIAFQISILEWLVHDKTKFHILHSHDHMTGLIPFFIQYGDNYSSLKDIPTVFTIHNGQYRGVFDWKVATMFPNYNADYNGLLDWDGHINSQATAIKCAWAINTVSPTYMNELQKDSDTLTSLMRDEKHKSIGILNGVDTKLWNPETDTYLDVHLNNKNWKKFKTHHKHDLIKKYDLKTRRPLISYIGRLAHQKGVDIIIKAIENLLQKKESINFIILGTGDKALEVQLKKLANKYQRDIAGIIDYDEGLARQIYAASDFLMMPSRFEPCGLNQMYAMRYGTIPIVRSIGGLKDTVPDVLAEGNGIAFENASASDLQIALIRAKDMYKSKKTFLKLRNKIVDLDFSWNGSASKYAALYQNLLN